MSQSLNVLKQPKPFYLIFMIELWERFGFYGLQALLAIYFVRMLGMDQTEAFVTFGAFTALVFGLMSVGGYLGDKVLGTKRTMVLGAIVLASGYLLLAFADHNKVLVYLALGSIAVGNGLFKANPSSLLAKCYNKDDNRLDGAFTMYYMSINIGSMFSMASVPYIADAFGWSMGFMASAIGLIIALVNYFFTRHWVADVGSAPDFRPLPFSTYAWVIGGVIAVIATSAWVLNHLTIANIILSIVGVSVLGLFTKEILASSGTERNKMIVALILMLQAVAFWTFYMQMPTSLNFFALNNVEPNLLGFTINPITFQSLNPFWIMVCSPILAYLYNRSGGGFSMPTKFAIGMLLCSASYLVLPLGAQFASAQGVVSSNWLVLNYFLLSVGELLISGLGLAMIAQLVPERLHGFIMGAWFLTTSAASVIAGYMASFTAIPASENGVDALQTLPVYSHFFETIGLAAAGVALVMLVMSPWLTRMIEAKGSECKRVLTAAEA